MEQLVIDNEIVGMTRFAKRGIEVNEETLALDSINEIGAGGDFLGHGTTLVNVEMPSRSIILDRQMYGAWDREGRKDTVDLAHEVVEDALAKPPRYPVDEKVVKEIDAIIERKLKELAKE